MKKILDVCCGSRMFYFDRENPLVHFNDLRREEHTLCDGRKLVIDPETDWDFTDLPVSDNSYPLVVFDPPHLRKAGADSWLRKKYGVLPENWRDTIRKGFAECLRVTKPDGIARAMAEQWSEYILNKQ